jgi:hypothetical protein
MAQDRGRGRGAGLALKTALFLLPLMGVAGSACSPTVRHPMKASSEGLPVEVSQPVEFVLASTIGKAGRLLAARVFDPSRGLRVVETGLVESSVVANGEPYPPSHPVTPLPAPYHGSTYVAFAVRAGHPGDYDGLGVILKWRSGGATYTRYLPVGFRLCVEASICNSASLTARIKALDLNDVPAG